MGAPQTLPANFTGWDSPPATLPKDFDKWDEQKTDSPGLSLDRLANEKLGKPTGYVDAAVRGLADVGQGVFQLANAVRHPIDTAKSLTEVGPKVMDFLSGSGEHTGQNPIQSAAEIAKNAYEHPAEAGQFVSNQIGQGVAGMILGKAPGVISDVAKASAERASMAAERIGKITPKQAAQGAGAISGAGLGHGTLSMPGAYYGAKTFGKIAESLLGKDRANSPIFKGNADLPLDDMADALAQTIADDRARVEINKSKGLGELPATGAKPASQTGEALATEPTRGPEPTGGKSAAPRFTQADRAAAQSLLQDALKQHSGDIIDAAIPPSGTTRGANLFTRTQVDAALKSGDVGQAEKVLDAAAKRIDPSYVPNREIQQSLKESLKKLGGADDGTTNGPVSSNGHTWQYNGHFLKDGKILDKSSDIADAVAALSQKDYFGGKTIEGTVSHKQLPSWTPLQRQIVPSVNEIRARVKAETPGSPQDVLETRGIQESMREDLQKHGWAAESEARREFIARNSTGMTKGELAKRFAATSGKAAPAAVPASDDLTDVLQKSLDAVRARSEQK